MYKVMVEMPAMKVKMPTAKIASRAKLPPTTRAPLADNARVPNASRVAHVPLIRNIHPQGRINVDRSRSSMIDQTTVSETRLCTRGWTTTHSPLCVRRRAG
jgi:hypothetical protein